MNHNEPPSPPPVAPEASPPWHRLAPRELVRAGFLFALGAGLLALTAAVTWRLAAAILAVAAPFVIGIVLALMLDPLVDRLMRRGLSRFGAVALVFGVFLVFLVGAGFLIVPALVNQATLLAENGPRYIQGVRGTIDEFLAHRRRIGTVTLPADFEALLAQLSERATAIVQLSAGRLADLLVGSVTALIQLVVTLIITFYLLVDIDRFRARLFYLAPERARGPMGKLGQDIGGVFSNYLRGLLIVCLFYGIGTVALLYGLSLLQPDLATYALLVGALAAVLYAVPYVGALVIALVTFLVGSAAGGFGFGGLAVGLTLILNQIFDSIVTPRVVGGGVGLHPVAALFALILGGSLFGLWGMVLSVPVAASIQVVLFRLFPRLTTPTPPAFLRAQGVRPSEPETAKILDSPEERPAAG